MTESPAVVRDLDLSGLKCPLPALHTRKALERAQAGDRIRLICTDPLTSIDIPHLLRETGDLLEEHTVRGGKLIFVIRRAKRAETQNGPA